MKPPNKSNERSFPRFQLSSLTCWRALKSFFCGMPNVNANDDTPSRSLVKGAVADNAYIFGSSLCKALANTLMIICLRNMSHPKKEKRKQQNPSICFVASVD